MSRDDASLALSGFQPGSADERSEEAHSSSSTGSPSHVQIAADVATGTERAEGVGGVDRRTVFSHCRRYRFALWREFYSVRAIEPPLLPVEGNEAHNYLMVIGLNPSTADETNDDPTIRRCIGFAKRWGFGALCMTNLFALRATDPEVMKADPAPTGDTNDDHLWTLAKGAGMILAAWGKDGNHKDRAAEVLTMLESFPIHALAINKDGTPKHPLYVRADTVPVRLGGGGGVLVGRCAPTTEAKANS